MGDVTRGRLFRVTTKAAEKFQVPSFKLDTVEGAIAALKSPNEAARYLVWEALKKLGEKAEPALQKLLDDKSAQPHHRARALWALANKERRLLAVGGVMAGSPHSLESALTDNDPNIRITAVRVARQLWQQKQPEKLREAIAKVIADPSPAVRREAAIALRFDANAEASNRWADLASLSIGVDRWTIEALGIGEGSAIEQRLVAFGASDYPKANPTPGPDVAAAILWRSRHRRTVELIAEALAQGESSVQTEMAPLIKKSPLIYLRALELQAETNPAEVSAAALSIFLKAEPETALAATALLDRNTIASNPEAKARLDSLLKPVIGKPEFIDLVQRLNLTGFEQELIDYITAHPDAGESINAARILAANVGKTVAFLTKADAASAKKLVAALGKVSDRPSVAVLNQAFWPEKREDVRRSIVEALALSGEGGRAILKWNSEDKLPESVKTTAALALSRSTDGGIRDQAGRELPLPAAMGLANFPPLPELMKMKGDAKRGATMFMQAGCVACHQIQGQFINFGPDLSEIGSKLSRDGMFTAILYPSAAVEHSYGGVQIKARDGSLTMGYVVSETSEELTLKVAGGAVKTVKKSDVASREEMKDSLMPPGLAGAIGVQGLVDLVNYLGSQTKK